MRNFFRKENGAVAVMVALGMTMILACAALAVDLGNSYRSRVKLQNAVDNAAYAAGSMLPSNKNAAVQNKIIAKVEEAFRINGVEPSSLDIRYDWDSSSQYLYALRVTAREEVGYGFAGIFGENSGFVSATAKASAEPISSTFSAIGIYIDKDDFEPQMEDIGDEETLLIKYNGPGTSHGTLMNMGLMRIVTEEDEINYQTYGDFKYNNTLYEEFFENGYYSIDSEGNKCGLAVGDVRYVENNSSYYNLAYKATQRRIQRCQENCGPECSAENHAPNCPRVALIPVCTVDEDHCGNSGKNNNNGTVTVEYFISVYIEDTYKTKGATIIEATPLETDRELTGIEADGGEAMINTYMVCGTKLEE